MPSRSFKALISDKNRFYSITIRTPRGRTIELYDSVKLLPFSLAQAAKAFKTKYQKLNMEYEALITILIVPYLRRITSILLLTCVFLENLWK